MAPSKSSVYQSQTKRSSSSSSTCTPGHDSPGCTFPTDNNVTLPVALGVIIPIACTVVAILFLTRRNRKRQRLEDANDKHASLDFGLGEVHRPLTTKKNKWGKKNQVVHEEPEMSSLEAERAFRHNRGLSLDLVGSPYVIPSEMDLAESRPSFQSHDDHDPYSPVALVRTNSPLTSQFPSRQASRRETASVFTQSSDHSNQPRNAQNPPQFSPEPEIKVSPVVSDLPPIIELPLPVAAPLRKPVAPALLDTSPLPESPTISETQSTPTFARSFSHRPSVSREEDMAAERAEQEAAAAAANPTAAIEPQQLPRPESPPYTSPRQSSRVSHLDFDYPQFNGSHANSYNFPTIEVTPTPPEDDFSPRQSREKSSLQPWTENSTAPLPAEKRAHSMEPYDDYETYADVLGIVQKESSYPLQEGEQMQGLGVQGVEYENKRLSTSIRPLPPEDSMDNPETRANRIRSFYREYFDESKRDTNFGLGGYAGAEYYEDYGQEYLDGATVFDPETGQFIVGGVAPYAQPVTRRAMTPPPRAPPRYGGPPGGHRYFGSGQYGPGGHRVRGHSSASGAGFRGRGPRKPPEPPKPLTNLPTPHLLKDDAAIFSAVDFAPPLGPRDRAVGRPDSPFADQRPYSPSVRAFSPLASPFDDLSAMPSPHHLRKSGTFTALDFAPPPRLKVGEGASDAGSIRSGRSNMSASQLANIRAGAYRLSRIPKNTVGTVDDMSQSLKPTWDLRGPTPGFS